MNGSDLKCLGRRWGFGIFILALALRWACAGWYQFSDLASCLGSDPSYYIDAARSIRAGNLYGNYGLNVGGPLYPYFLALMMSLVGDHPLRLMLFQSVVGSCTPLLAALIAAHIHSRKAGIVAGVACALCGPLVFADLNFENEFLIPVLGLCSVAFLHRRPESGAAAAAAGFLLGLGALLRGNQALPILFVAAWTIYKTPRQGALLRVLLLILGSTLALTPFTLRNYHLYHEFLPFSAHGGITFYMGNHPGATYRYDRLPFGESNTEGEFPAAWQEANRLTGKELSPGEVSSYWFRQGLRFIVDSPGAFALNFLNRLRAFLNDYEVPDNYDFRYIKQYIPPLAIAFVSVGMIVPFVPAGLFALTRAEALLLGGFPLTSLLTSLLFYYNSRFRLTCVPFLIIFASVGLVDLLKQVRPRVSSQAKYLLVTAAALAIVAFMPPQSRDDFYFSLLMHGRCVEDHAAEEAEHLYRRAAALHPREPEAYLALADIMTTQGKLADAFALLAPLKREPLILVRRAQVAMDLGDFPAALTLYRQAIALRPAMIDAIRGEAMALSRLGHHREALEALEQSFLLKKPGKEELGIAIRFAEAAGDQRKKEEYMQRRADH